VYDHTPEGAVVPGVLTCPCVRDRDIRMNMERGWRGLSTADPVRESWLEEYTDKDLWVTADSRTFRRHMRLIAHGMGPHWRFQVSSDADLMDAWLSHIGPQELYDADVNLLRAQNEQVSSRFPALVDLFEPPALLVISVSVKAARNAAMPEVLLEALQHRAHLGAPTWIVDLPNKPLGPDHIAFSDGVGDFLWEWPHITLDAGEDGSGSALPDAESLCGVPQRGLKERPPGMSLAAWARIQAEGETS